MIFNPPKTKDINWAGFKISSNLHKRIKKAKGTIRISFIEARAKSLLTHLSTQIYESKLTDWKSQLTLQEDDFAIELKNAWRKKYFERLKKQEKDEGLSKSLQADAALKASKGFHKNNKKQKKWNKNKDIFPKPTITPLAALGVKCGLCGDRGILHANNEYYPCPACSPKKEEPPKPKPKKKAVKKPNLGQRKLKFK